MRSKKIKQHLKKVKNILKKVLTLYLQYVIIIEYETTEKKNIFFIYKLV